MFEQHEKSVVIVCDSKTKEYGVYLQNLIAECNDEENAVVGVPDGMVNAVVVDPKKYSSDPEHMNSNQYVIFIGKNKEAKYVIPNIKLKFDKFGIKYGWLGRRAVVFIDEKVYLSDEDYREFLKLCGDLKFEFENLKERKALVNKIAQKTVETARTVVKEDVAKVAGDVATVLAMTSVVVAVEQIITLGKQSADMLKQRYTFAILNMYLEHLSDFLGTGNVRS